MTYLKTSDFDYILPPDLIAQTPIELRDHSRLLVVKREDGSLDHRQFFELTGYLKDGDILVFNNSRVIRARLFGIRTDNSQSIEILLLRRLEPNTWETLIGSRKRVTVGIRVMIKGDPQVEGEIIRLGENGTRVVRFSDESVLPRLGQVPLPPYIHTPLSDPERYQTVYADPEGSVAAPTAGLHFTPELLQKIQKMGVECLFVTLHVGLSTFRPVQVENALTNPILPEYGVISEEITGRINQAKKEQRRVIGVGTTSVRLLESAAQSSNGKAVEPFQGWANLFIYPGYRFKIVDAIITNFHLPKSTLLMLVSAFAGKDLIFKAYREAIEQKYRFYSFGDAMMVF